MRIVKLWRLTAFLVILLLAVVLLSTSLVQAQDGELHGFGDSVTVGMCDGVQLPYEDRYINKIEYPDACPYWSIVYNHAIGGAWGADMCNQVFIDGVSFRRVVTNVTRSTFLVGYNDMGNLGTDPGGQETFNWSLVNNLAWMSLLDTAKVNIRTNTTTTGSWLDFVGYNGVLGSYTTTNGATMNFTTQGETAYIFSVKYVGNTHGTFTVHVDGTLEGSYDCNGMTGPTGHGMNYVPYPIRITGLANTTHNIQVTSTSTNGVYMLWAAPIAGTNFADYTTNVWCGNCLQPNYPGDEIAVVQYNYIIATTVEQLNNDGMNVVHVDASSALTESSHFCIDNVHPNALGHTDLADAFIDAIICSPPISTPTPTPTTTPTTTPTESGDNSFLLGFLLLPLGLLGLGLYSQQAWICLTAGVAWVGLGAYIITAFSPSVGEPIWIMSIVSIGIALAVFVMVLGLRSKA